ncbi:jg4385 [Pararge aegeria aegeria]|uniref:Jg4385 protein n=1 Tax=Pararge aegeria aegeria TaxID=348720 RepID=A0A8S4QQU7_9NEOP|nr:jg4385 [Pararge aegeria aegeria]
MGGCYGVTGRVGRVRELAMRRAPELDDIGDPNAPVTVVHVRMLSEIGALVFAGEDAVFVACVCVLLGHVVGCYFIVRVVQDMLRTSPLWLDVGDGGKSGRLDR